MNSIELKQAPVIEYSVLNELSLSVKEKIDALDLENIEVTEASLALVKNTRADLNRDFKELEERRKLVKDLIMKPYNEFEAQYKVKISNLFNEADSLLKTKIDEVDKGILDRKISTIKDYFDANNTFKFLAFEDLGLKILKSNSDKSYFEQIDTYLSTVKKDLEIISTMTFEERITAKYQIYKDLAKAVSEVQIEVKKEDELRDAKKRAEQAKAEVKQDANPAVTPVSEPIVEPAPLKEDDTVYKCSFTIHATRAQLREIRSYFVEKGIRYE
jgi:hypothetical protein